ncbi:MAG: transporter glutamine-binding protein GlnH [Bacillota bacterium]|jgi:putative glutamine transport system substrate-binding protein
MLSLFRKKRVLGKKFLLFLGTALCVLSFVGCSTLNRPQVRTLKEILSRGKLVVGVKYDTPLFGYFDTETNQLEGFEIDLAKAINNKLHNEFGQPSKLVFKEVSTQTKLAALEQGNVDLVVAAMTITGARKKLCDFSTPYFSTNLALLTSAKSPLTNVRGLHNKKVAALKGAISGRILQDTLKDLGLDTTIEYFNNYSDGVTAVKAKRVYALITEKSILQGIQKQTHAFKIVEDHKHLAKHEEYGIALHKGNDELLAWINKCLQELQDDGTYEKLIIKHFGRSQLNTAFYSSVRSNTKEVTR